MLSDKERREAIGRMLSLISDTANYYSLQAANEGSDTLTRALPEMRDLLLQYESLIGLNNEEASPKTTSITVSQFSVEE